MKPDIRAIILDVDGVIVGEKIGFNSPWPHPQVIQALKQVKQKSIPTSLCTAKPHFAIQKIINDAHLDNVHITDGGGVIIDPINQTIAKIYPIPEIHTHKVIKTLLKANIYTEFYSPTNYYIQTSQVGEITHQHIHVLQTRPQQVNSLLDEAKHHQITKIMPIAANESQKQQVQDLFNFAHTPLTLSWGIHPAVLPLQFGIITAPGISKKQGALDISQSTKIGLDHTLGVGDSSSDWQFIELCGYRAAMGNASNDLKTLVRKTNTQHSFVGLNVNQNGIINIFSHFQLL